MSRVNWMQVGVFAAVVLVILGILLVLVIGFGGSGMMGPGMMWRGWSEGACPFWGGGGRFPGGWLGGMFGWLLMLVAWFLPLGLLALLAVGVVWVVRTVAQLASAMAPSPKVCPSCGKPVAGDWRLCPHCGEELRRLEQS